MNYIEIERPTEALNRSQEVGHKEQVWFNKHNILPCIGHGVWTFIGRPAGEQPRFGFQFLHSKRVDVAPMNKEPVRENAWYRIDLRSLKNRLAGKRNPIYLRSGIGYRLPVACFRLV